MNIDDEVILRALRKSNEIDDEPKREDEYSDEEPSTPKFVQPPPKDPDMQRLQNDTALRQHLGIGTAFTGPKGVRQDYKFHLKQERLRAAEKQAKEYAMLSKQALSSGWLQRTIADEEKPKVHDDEDIDDDEFFKEYRDKQMMNFYNGLKSFGFVYELDQNSFAASIENENDNVTILIHFYDERNHNSTVVNEYFTNLAAKHRHTKFCKVVATKLVPLYDLIALPAIYVYKAGELVNLLLRIHEEIPDWIETGRVNLKDFEDYLVIQGVLRKVHVAESDNDDEFD
jgi:hypothetical protein